MGTVFKVCVISVQAMTHTITKQRLIQAQLWCQNMYYPQPEEKEGEMGKY